MAANSGSNYWGSRRPLNKRKRRKRPDARTTIGSAHLPVYQAGGPPLDYEKTGWSFFGLRGTVESIGHVRKAIPSLPHRAWSEDSFKNCSRLIRHE
jgi:hypothetical protein